MTRQPLDQPRYAKSGYAAITSILVILSTLVLAGLTTTYLGIGNAQMSLGQSRGEASLQLIESCIEDALLYYSNNGTIPATRSTSQGTCTLVVNASGASSITFTTTATLDTSSHSVQVSATRDSSVVVVNWVQIN